MDDEKQKSEHSHFNEASISEAELAAMRTTLDRVNRYLSDFGLKQDSIGDGIEEVNKILHGNGIPGLTEEVEKLKQYSENYLDNNNRLENKLNKLDKYEKFLKWMIFVAVPAIIFSMVELAIIIVDRLF